MSSKKSQQAESADVLCPFYRHEDLRTLAVTCEGVLPGSTIKSHFGSIDKLRGHQRRFCAADYRLCPWYRVVYIKYSDDR